LPVNIWDRWCWVIFVVGIVAAAFSSADSALTALTTSFCVDILHMKAVTQTKEEERKDIRTRRIVHVAISAVFVLIILLIEASRVRQHHQRHLQAGFLYLWAIVGTLFFGLYTKVKPTDKYVPWVAIAAPVLCFVTEVSMKQWFGYQVGYELLLLNGLITGLGLWAIRLRH